MAAVSDDKNAPARAFGFAGLRGGLDRYAVLAAVAFSISVFTSVIVNSAVYPQVGQFYGFAREIATLVGGLAYLAALLIVRFKPEFLLVRRMSLAFALLCVAMVPLLIYALDAASPAATVAALCIRSVTRAWVLTLLAVVLVRIRSVRTVPIVVTVGWLAAALVRPVQSLFPATWVTVLVMGACLVFVIGLLTPAAAPVLDTIRTGAPAELVELLHPGSFLNLAHGFFMCALLFSIANGFCLTFREVDSAPIFTAAPGYLLLFGVALLFFVRRSLQEDSLFSFSVVLVMAGFLLAPATAGTDVDTANSLIDVGGNCFEMLIWLVLASVGKRNLFAMLPAFGFVQFLKALGTDIGASAGRAANSVVYGNEHAALLVSLGFAFVFFVFLWLGFRNFSFSEALKGLEPIQGASVQSVRMEDAQASAEAAGHDANETRSIERRCALIGESCGLTSREQELFVMLARGRNARFIMEDLVLSRNTVKSHIKHIYAKLNVHSQQELIDLVETS